MEKVNLGTDEALTLDHTPLYACWSDKGALMPPKKKAGAVTTIHADLLAAFDETKSAASLRPDRLSSDLLARAYGLAGHRDSQKPVKQLHKACPPRWTEEAEQERAKKEEVKESPEVIVLDGTDDEGKKTRGGDRKGKGKAKATAGEVKEKPCSAENCGNNPRCLNWLGQDKWENSGAVQRFMMVVQER